MTAPREILPGRYYKITRRCTQRQFLLRPDEETNNAFLYCLAEASVRFEISVLASSVQSNHHHTDVYDPHGCIIEFMEHLHKMLAKCMNALRGRNENFWSTDDASLVHLVDPIDVVEAVVYTLSNPVKDGLVDTVAHWPGLNTLKSMLTGTTLSARRPTHFFRENGVMPSEVTLQIAIPAELGDSSAFCQLVEDGVSAVENRKREERAATGRRVIGRARVLRQSWRDCPSTDEPRGSLNPRVAARSKWHRIATLLGTKAFVAAYKAARLAWLAGLDVVFPPGTYWLRRFANVRVAAVPL